MSLKHAILGFLAFDSSSGYDLKKAFDGSVQHFWPANQSQIYRTLAKLKEEGLVDLEVVEREQRLDMKIYHITDMGSEELHRWLSTPLPPQVFREPFMIQIFFGSKLTDEEFEELLQHEIRAAEEILAVYNLMYENIKSREDSRAFFLSMLPLEYGIRNNQSLLEWLKSVVERVRSEDYSLKELK
ncbi:MAG: PadR family transcriptional regulator [Chloroflexi bacterium]|nr:MAG: PadR family transcriptional regulator [Chloroflexota bacterium]MBL1196742.1 PadR family transcriptional regulator [Chloroflexota bacterium]NOH14036.1 PadR family transcriptional regulator [Chloroflexota bacterium]